MPPRPPRPARQRKNLACLGLAAALSFLPGVGFALTLAEVQREAALRLEREAPKAVLDWLIAQEGQHAGDPDFDYLLGTTALAAGDTATAILALERVTLVQPAFAGAWLDLALAYHRSGDLDMAEALLQHIETHFSPPNSLGRQIEAARKKVRELRLARDWSGDAVVLLGHARNANFGLSSTNLQLTIPGLQPLTLTVDKANRRHASAGLDARAQIARHIHHADGSHSDLLGFMRTRQYLESGTQSYSDLSLGGIHARPLLDLARTETLLGLNLRHLTLDGENLGGFVTASTGVRHRLGPCRATGRLDLERRMYATGGQSDSTIPWLGGTLECGFARASLDLSQRFGWDTPDSTRAGGDIWRMETALRLRWMPRDTLQIGATLYYADYQDQDGYSPLLEHNAARNIHRLGKKIELSWVPPLDGAERWAVQVELEDIVDRSNLAIGQLNDTQGWIGLRYRMF